MTSGVRAVRDTKIVAAALEGLSGAGAKLGNAFAGWAKGLGSGGGGKASFSAVKEAVRKAQNAVGGLLPPGKPGKFGSPQRGTSQKGYRLDPGHPNRPAGDPEHGPHVNWWDYTEGKRGRGGRDGVFPIEE